MQQLELKVLPPVVMLVVALLMWLAAEQLPSLMLFVPYNLIMATVMAIAGLTVAFLGVMALRRHDTTVNPMKPGTTTALVGTGIYAWTRNPIYLGDLLILLAWAAYLSNVVSWFLPMIFVAYINRFQIEPEEAHLRDLFGEPFDLYREKVRRWF